VGHHDEVCQIEEDPYNQARKAVLRKQDEPADKAFFDNYFTVNL